ncbi:hypothetical protein GXW74_14295 [Roseomonas eburnea]|uniref:Lipoprotein n=1 Tax=Neoroseomonas eburnea TaxID=1346889 RepID=A0A9X9XD76_9PROT|nr:hypothetical protein [Neoroseomonas eburnea]MBR0681662.1 hypothetical protein [Neoroseomonas eburnea]
MLGMRLLLPFCAGLGLVGCIAYPAPVPYAAGPYGTAPVYVEPAPPPARVYVAPPPRRHWVPRRCDAWGRCWGGYWR